MPHKHLLEAGFREAVVSGYAHVVLRAPNDANGNPRRLSLLLNGQRVLRVEDHGYVGPPRVEPWGNVVLDLRVAATVYREWAEIGRLMRAGAQPFAD